MGRGLMDVLNSIRSNGGGGGEGRSGTAGGQWNSATGTKRNNKADAVIQGAPAAYRYLHQTVRHTVGQQAT